MKLTIAVLGTTVVANVYAVAIDCTQVRGQHVSAPCRIIYMHMQKLKHTVVVAEA